MERNAETAKNRLVKLFPDIWQDGSEYNSQPINPKTSNRLSSRLVTWIKESIASNYATEKYLVNLCWPNVEVVESRMMVKLWLNQDDRDKGFAARRLMKPGKALRHLFPWMSDSDVEKYVDAMRLELGERQYTLKTGRDADTFRDVYTGTQCRMENPATSTMRKSLANSCMRYEDIMHHDIDGVLRHPVEAYASGEFEIVYVTDNKGHIAARCVVWIGDGSCDGFKPVWAPIYGVCEKSMDMIESHLDNIGAIDSNWRGAALVRIEGKDGGYIAPYLDLSPQHLDDNGSHLVVDSLGDIDASVYSGLLRDEPESMCDCENCGERYDSEDSGGMVGEQHVCDSCYYDSNYCECYEERTFQDCETVYLWRNGRAVEETWCDDAVDSYAERVDGVYWRADDLYTDHDGDYITPEQVDNGEYFLSDWSAEFYPSADMCETDDGEIVSRQELDDDRGIWEQAANGIWHNVQLDLDLEGEAA